MKVRFIINSHAGRSGKLSRLSEAIRKVLKDEAGIFEVKAAMDREHAARLSSDAAEKGYEVVFACGGDGTINNIASALVGTDTALGILPTGSGNALACSLGIPFDLEGAIGLLKSGRIRAMDAGVACGRYFFSTAGFAFEAHLSRRYNEGRLSSRIRGIAPYFPLALLEYFRFRPGEVVLTVDGSAIEGRPLLLTAANTGHFGGNAVISPDARMDDGLLDFAFVPRTSFFSALGLGLKLFRGKIASHKGLRLARGKEAEIKGWNLSAVHVDGEPFEWRGDVEISVLPGKIRVLTP
ncbi:MAG: hypothetical protein A2054_03600 [Deltaproteobacteria bacterium GWA2_55_10]|nr:MAG: hypothetical protein A2054_03600 [Deltaproteobacteria bacterium GWA2_55_10]